VTTISAERSKLAKVGLSLRRREQWGARRSYTDARSVTEPATRVFVHITVSNPSSYNGNDAHARAIEAIGISRFPKTGISYNRLIMPNGAIYEAQPIGRRGAHTVNDFRRSSCSTPGCPDRGSSLTAPSWNLNINARSYAICQNVGHPVSDKMVDSIARAIAADKLAGFVTRSAPIHGHRCVASKSCPGDKMWARMGELERRVNHYVKNGLNGDGEVASNDTIIKNNSVWWDSIFQKKSNPKQRMRAYSYLTYIHAYVLDVRRALTQTLPFNSWMEKRWGKANYSVRTYIRTAYGHARAGNENSAEALKVLAAQAKLLSKQAGEIAAVKELVRQLIAREPMNEQLVEAAAQRGALAGSVEALDDLGLDFQVTITPTEEPTELAESAEPEDEPDERIESVEQLSDESAVDV
jgi:hypothetical protein